MTALHIPLTPVGVPWAWQGPLALPLPAVTLNPSGTQGKGMHRGWGLETHRGAGAGTRLQLEELSSPHGYSGPQVQGQR